MPSLAPLILYYDGLCILCSKEMEMYQKQDANQQLVLVDISEPHFDAAKLGLDAKAVNKHFHAQVENQSVFYVGVDAFIEIWKRLPKWNKVAILAEKAPARFILKQLYKLFVIARPYLPRKKGCDNGHCNLG